MMNLDDADLTPAAGKLRRPVQVHRQTVAQFTPTATLDPAEVWEPFSRPTFDTTDGTQGNPLGSFRPGRSIEHEPMDNAERDAQRTAQQASHVGAAQQVRAALRPCSF
jgi:hypothetical protein